MKIGDFSKKHNVTVNAIRHYMDLKLIVPEKKGAQYFFDEICSKDLNEIIFFKDIGFSLSEIQKFFTLKRFGMLKSERDANYYKELLLSKRYLLIDEIQNLNSSISKIDAELENISKLTFKKENTDDSGVLGFPLSSISMLSCPHCKNQLFLNDASFNKNMIINGTFSCACGFTSRVVDGILMTDFDITQKYNDLQYYKHYSTEYMEQSCIELVNFLAKGSSWIFQKLMNMSLSKKTILDLGTGTGVFFKHAHKLFQKDTIYIATNTDIEVLKDFKKNLETNLDFSNVIFICSDYTNLPLRNSSIDLILDFFATTRYTYLYKDFLINLLSEKLCENGSWLGTYIYLDETSNVLSHYPKDFRPFFLSNYIHNALNNSMLFKESLNEMGYIENVSVCPEYLEMSERLYQLTYHGIKKEM